MGRLHIIAVSDRGKPGVLRKPRAHRTQSGWPGAGPESQNPTDHFYLQQQRKAVITYSGKLCEGPAGI